MPVLTFRIGRGIGAIGVGLGMSPVLEKRAMRGSAKFGSFAMSALVMEVLVLKPDRFLRCIRRLTAVLWVSLDVVRSNPGSFSGDVGCTIGIVADCDVSGMVAGT